MTESTPQESPKPLRTSWLAQRAACDRQWESLSRLNENELREILDWAQDQLCMIFMAQDLGLGPDDPQFLHQLDHLYDTIRNAMTRQDLILGFLLIVQARAQEQAKAMQKDFALELSRLTDPDVF